MRYRVERATEDFAEEITRLLNRIDGYEVYEIDQQALSLRLCEIQRTKDDYFNSISKVQSISPDWELLASRIYLNWVQETMDTIITGEIENSVLVAPF